MFSRQLFDDEAAELTGGSGDDDGHGGGGAVVLNQWGTCWPSWRARPAALGLGRVRSRMTGSSRSVFRSYVARRGSTPV
jgi:hypothetical protein